MNKIISQTIVYRGKEISIDSLKENSNIKIIVECKHGQRQVRWSRRNQLCKKCAIEKGAFNTSKTGRKINWGQKISAAKKNVKLSDEHKKSLIKVRIKKICKKKNIDESMFNGFPTSGNQFKLRSFMMNSINKKIIKYSVEEQDSVLLRNLGYTVSELKTHLESKFKDGMTWENYGQWHIDHVRPESWFSYDKIGDDDFKKCWSLENLQPMWAKDNIDKSNKYEGDHVPRKFYMLAGQFGAGKTTMCKLLQDKFTVVHYDKLNIKKLDSFIANNYFNEKPILIDIPTNISTVYNRYKDRYDINLTLILETEEVIAERISKRGGEPNIDNIRKRRNRMLSIKERYSSYAGTYDEVLLFMLNLKI